MLTLATEASVVSSRAPSSRTTGSSVFLALPSSTWGTVNDRSVSPPWPTFWTMRSMLTPASASGSKIGAGDARAVRDGHDRDLGDVPVVGEPADLVALLHERILLDERAGRVLERAQHLDDDVVDPAELDRADLHDLGALVGQLEHLLVADDRQLAGGRDEPGVGGVDAAHVGEDLAAVGAQRGGQGDGRGVAAAPAEGRDLLVQRGRGALALEAGDDDDLAALELGPDPARLDAGDARPAVRAVRGDARPAARSG